VASAPGGAESGAAEPRELELLTLSERRTSWLVTNEVHRSSCDFIGGFTRHMHDELPNALLIGFTGIPADKSVANTGIVFGHYITAYGIQHTVEKIATVPLCNESHLAKPAIEETEEPTVEPEFEDATEGGGASARSSSRVCGRRSRPSSARKSA
jgi:type I restriction enzyme R subunit